MTPALRVGLVGCGRLAQVGYLPAVALVDDVRLVAVADPDPDRRDHVARLAADDGTMPSTFADARGLLAGVELDAVVVASPVGAHVDDAHAAAAAGVAVLVEKPPARDATDAAALAASSPSPWIGFNRRFDPGARRVRDAIQADGSLDLVLEIRYRRCSWRAFAVRDDALLDLGPHLVDWARWLSSSNVTAVGEASITGERATFTLSLGRGRVRVAASTDRTHRERIDVRDGAGAPVTRHRVGGPVAAITGRRSRGTHPLVASLAAQLRAFAGAVHGEAPGDLGTAGDGVAAMRAIDAVRAEVPPPMEPGSHSPVPWTR